MSEFPITPNRPTDYTCRFDWRHQYDDVRDAEERALTDVDASQPSGVITNQSFAQDADLNEMVRRFGITDHAIPPRALDPTYFGDFTDAPSSYREAIDRVREANARFDALPAHIRSRFDNDPTRLWEWINDGANAEEAYKLGLLQKHPDPTSPHENAAPTPPTGGVT